jgi:hypothetical protein
MMLYLRLIIHNQAKIPIFLEVAIPPELRDAIRMSKVSRCDLLLYEKNPANQIVIPGKTFIPGGTLPQGELSRYKILG